MNRSSNAVNYGRLVSRKKFPSVVYGLQGIMDLFNISKSTAWRYRHGIIKDACTQNGNVIIVDTKKALTLFGVSHPEEIIDPNGDIPEMPEM